MKVLRLGELLEEGWRGSAVTIGAYDGVHLGHRALIGEMRSRAEAEGLASVVVTFDRHPASVVRPGSAPKLLTDVAQKLELLESTGIDATLVVEFDAERSAQHAEEFVREVLVAALATRLVVVGSDFHFGAGRRGNLAMLSALGRSEGFAVEGVELVPGGVAGSVGSADNTEPISSTRIRALLTGGRVEEAAALLGRDHEIRGMVVHGDGRGGSELGFPTANLQVDREILLPGDGIYAGYARRHDALWEPMVASIGRRPTFKGANQDHSLLEAHLLDFSGDLYSSELRVRLHRRLRDELAFPSVEELVEQMERDVVEARRVLEV